MLDSIMNMPDSGDARVLNMLEPHMILNKILHDIWQGLEYASSSEYAMIH